MQMPMFATRKRGLLAIDTGETCFLPVRGLELGTANCSRGGLSTPILSYSTADRFGATHAVDVIGVARHSVTSVAMVGANGSASGLALIERRAGTWSFAGGYTNAKTVVARVASGRVVARLALDS